MRDQGYQRPAEANAVVHGKRSGPREWFTEPPEKALDGLVDNLHYNFTKS
jgi:hypothetical protein